MTAPPPPELPDVPEPEPYPVELDLPERVVVIGDLNGHPQLFERLLAGTGLVDLEGRWSGGSTVLVQMGDLVNRGTGSRSAMERLLHLRGEARRNGGEVLWLLGNHEAMTALRHEAYVTPEEYLEFAPTEEVDRFLDARTRYVYELLGPPDVLHEVEPIGGRVRAWEDANAPGKEAFRAAFGERGALGRHLRHLPVAVRLGPLLFVHGGLSPHWARLGLLGLEEKAREAWARSPQRYQELEPNGLIRDPLGPLWHRLYCVSEVEAVERDAEEALAELNAERMLVGHTRTETVPGGLSGRPLLRLSGRVLMTDVGIGEPGEPGCALVIEDGTIDAWSPIDGRYKLCAVERRAGSAGGRPSGGRDLSAAR